MTSGLVCAAANGLVTLGSAPAARALARVFHDPRAAQRRVFERIREQARDSAYGRHHRLGSAPTLDAWRAQAPMVRFADLAPWIERIAAGERDVLTATPTLFFERSSGSSGAVKLVPYNRALLDDFDRAISPWLFDLHAHRPALWPLASYWSISPLAATGERTPGDIPIGIEDDSEYLSPAVRRLIDATRVVPSDVRRITDLEAWRYVTLRFLAGSERLGLVSVWSPSFWRVLCDSLGEDTARLIRDVRDGTLTPPGWLPAATRARLTARLRPDAARAAALEAIALGAGSLVASEVWPRLQLLSCWTAAASAAGARDLARHFPNTEIQGKGLLATEGVVSIPLTGHPGAAPALLSHLLEFRPRDAADHETCFVDELDTGQDYEVILTTSGGLYRYALGDAVRVVGRIGRTPLIEFVGRVDRVVDLVGEKLEERFVASCIARGLAGLSAAPSFAMLAPEDGTPPHYVLFVEIRQGSPTADLAMRLDRALAGNPHYDYARRLGQLGAVEVVPVEHGERRYLDGCVALGQRAGDVKPTALHRDTGWRARFRPSGRSLEGRAPARPAPNGSGFRRE